MSDAARYSEGETVAQAALKKASRIVLVRFHAVGRLDEGDLTVMLMDAGAMGRHMEAARAHLRAVLGFTHLAPLGDWLAKADRATTSAMLVKAAATPGRPAEVLTRAAALVCVSGRDEHVHHLTTEEFHGLLSDVGGPVPVRERALRIFQNLHLGRPPSSLPLEDWLGLTEREDVAEALRRSAAYAELPCAREEAGPVAGV